MKKNLKMKTTSKQAGAELGQAQLKPGFGFTSIALQKIIGQELIFTWLTAANDFWGHVAKTANNLPLSQNI